MYLLLSLEANSGRKYRQFEIFGILSVFGIFRYLEYRRRYRSVSVRYRYYRPTLSRDNSDVAEVAWLNA